MEKSWSMLSNLVYDGPRTQNIKEIESRVEKVVIDNSFRCSDQLVKITDSKLLILEVLKLVDVTESKEPSR